MLLRYGTGGGESELGAFDALSCPHCGAITPTTALVQYTYFHLWYLFSFLTDRTYMLRCENCHAERHPSEEGIREIKDRFPLDRIPFVHKNGALLCLCVLSAVLFLMSLADTFASHRTDARIAAPQPGDLYLADLAAVDDSGFGLDNPNILTGRKAYGSMRLLRFEDGRYYFASSHKAYEQMSELKKRLPTLQYDLETSFALTGAEMARLREAGVIVDVQRR